MCKIFASEFGSKSGIMGGFQKGITLGGRTSRSFPILDLQKWVAKNLQNFCMYVGIQVKGHERFPKRYNTWG